MEVEIVRFNYSPICTQGFLYAANLRIATLEESWSPDPDGPGGQRREIGKRESCVPDGPYTLYSHIGARWKDVWCLENKALGVYRREADKPSGFYGRSAILIHPGKSLDATLGCVLIGMAHDGLFLTETQKAVDALRAVLGGGTHHLQIRPRAGTAEVL